MVRGMGVCGPSRGWGGGGGVWGDPGGGGGGGGGVAGERGGCLGGGEGVQVEKGVHDVCVAARPQQLA